MNEKLGGAVAAVESKSIANPELSRSVAVMGVWFQWIRSRIVPIALFSWAGAIAVVVIRVARHPGTHSAFRACWLAGGSWLHGARFYGTDTGFLYTPLIAALYAPFALLPAGVAEVVWRLVIGVSLPAAIWFSGRALFNFRNTQSALLLLLTLPLTVNTLNNGQANLVLVALLLFAAAAAAQSQWLLCASCAAFAIYWKTYPIAFALLLIVIFPGKLGWRTLLAVIVLFGVSLLLQQPSYVLHQYSEWFSNLISDRRRDIGYYGKNRDFYLLLRLCGIRISMLWWMLLQLVAGLVAAASVSLQSARQLPAAKLLFGTMSIAIAWMLLFGPATEGATYVLIAIPAAYLLMSVWSEEQQPSMRAVCTIPYAGFVLAEIVNSWLRIKQNIHLVHAIQPCVAILFCVALYVWWKRQPGPEPSAVLQR